MAIDSTRRLHHATPAWVKADAAFHIRIRLAPIRSKPLIEPATGTALLESAGFYHRRDSWFCHLFLLMLDHLHALLCFPREVDMRIVVGRWKAWQTRTLGVNWQDNFFDHRIRSARELRLKADYISQNPVVKGLCAKADDWPWVIDTTHIE